MKQVVVIGGGDSFATHDAYLDFLRGFKIESVDYFKPRSDWKRNLPETLGTKYEVLAPQMPSKWNAKYAEWELWFEKLVPFLHDDVVLVGHSLGASFLAKYLSGHELPVRVAATLLVAAPFDEDEGRKLAEFDAPADFSRLIKRGGKIFLYHSKDDPVVPFSELAKFQKVLPSATARVFEDRGHFNQSDFPELVADVKRL